MLNLKTLREQVYDYLRGELSEGKLKPGDVINMKKICDELGISTTPLRDALIQLEMEGFVKILPRRGIVVNTLSIEDIRKHYEVIGALEGALVEQVFDKITPEHLEELESLNEKMRLAMSNNEYDNYYHLNLRFHRVFQELSDNDLLARIVEPLKERLWDFPRRDVDREWGLDKCFEHQKLIEAIKNKDRDEAVRVVKKLHWSHEAQDRFIHNFYFGD